MGVHAVEEDASDEGSADVASGAAHEDVGDVADVLLHVHGQVLERGAENGDAHPLRGHREDGSRRKLEGKTQERVSGFYLALKYPP